MELEAFVVKEKKDAGPCVVCQNRPANFEVGRGIIKFVVCGPDALGVQDQAARTDAWIEGEKAIQRRLEEQAQREARGFEEQLEARKEKK